MENNEVEKLIDRMARVLDRYYLVEKTPREFGTGNMLYPSEIHTVEAIGKNIGINVTELALTLGVSKPAISQIIKKLEKKRLIVRSAAKDNIKEVLLHLTEMGKTAYVNHRKFHENMDKVIVKRLRKLTKEEHSFLEVMISQFEEYVKIVLEERK